MGERRRARGDGAPLVGRVIGTEDATPWSSGSAWPEQFLQLDDVVALERTPPGRGPVKIYGVVDQVRARHEGARFDTDVWLIEDGVLPAEVAEAAQVRPPGSTRGVRPAAAPARPCAGPRAPSATRRCSSTA